MLLAAIVCAIGVYGSSSIAAHAGLVDGRARKVWGVVGITAAGCTAWATHMIGLFAFQPGMEAGFDPTLMAVSLIAGTVGIGAGVWLGVGRHDRERRFVAGVVLGLGVTTLHYLGQASYVVTGYVVWDDVLVGGSIVVSLAMFGVATVASGDRRPPIRRLGAPLLLAAIAVLHFSGMAAATFVFDPRIELGPAILPARLVAPVVAGASAVLFVLAVLGLRFALAARAAARRDRERLRELASVAVEGLLLCDGELIATINQSLEELSGLPSAALSGRPMSVLLPGVNLVNLPERQELDAELVAANGQRVPVRVLRREVHFGRERQAVVAIRDQRERLSAEQRMRTLAFSDALTGLPNRARFGDLLAARAAACLSNGAQLAILLIDLDRFKFVNDTFGHAAGDALLRQVAQRLEASAGSRSVVARLGGDEFAVLAPDGVTEFDAERLAQAVVDSLSRPFTLQNNTVEIGASAGLAIAPNDGEQPEELLRNADLALYRAKLDGKGLARRFDPELQRQARERQQMEIDLAQALIRNEFEVHYQPLVDPRTLEVKAAEALVRWRHPGRGLVSPVDFITVAEETGLISGIGSWVLSRACQDAASWPSHMRIAVNLSPTQFRDPALIETIMGALSASGLPPQRLVLEITEGVLLLDEARTLTTLELLRAYGIGLAMDDFGTGYASLGYLRRFPFSKIKIDRSFVRDLPADRGCAAIFQAIVALAGALNMSITVEGVETVEQLNFAAEEGCDLVQGYYLSRPLPLAEFHLFLNRREAA
ncbi:putative bifunctional diguanylate cyclase/phosphodiesterase [Hansschlegelia quercus]|uniref:EAL domain-containing protein n=1 Tax=Hansschlegelia quercus TaxID=2528245 RepID=A0A4Q9GQY6_9HYPH|nr:EAL domain-containing protein [Hansschlegelia quercus]TBN55224.1 EAL domain-containing protein [Hansschlegelia quercus]